MPILTKEFVKILTTLDFILKFFVKAANRGFCSDWSSFSSS